MFRVIQLYVFVFVFGRIVHRTIRIRPNSLIPRNNCDCFQKRKENTTDLHQSMYCYLLFTKIIV